MLYILMLFSIKLIKVKQIWLTRFLGIEAFRDRGSIYIITNYCLNCQRLHMLHRSLSLANSSARTHVVVDSWCLSGATRTTHALPAAAAAVQFYVFRTSHNLQFCTVVHKPFIILIIYRLNNFYENAEIMFKTNIAYDFLIIK